MRRALLLLAAIVSLAATFGGPEEVDPKAAPETLGYGTVDQIGVDGTGRAYWLTERDAKALVLERCGGGWQPALQIGEDAVIQDLAVAASGAAVAVWFEDGERELWSAYRSPAGSWSTALVRSGTQMFGADAAIGANGDVVLAWAAVQGDKVSASFRPAATGAWEAPTPLAGEGNPRVAISGGDATVVAVDDWTVTHKVVAFPRPWGGAPETVVATDNLRSDPWIDYDPSGRPAVVWVEQTPQHYRVLKASVRAGGWPTASDIDFTDFPAFLVLEALARHPQGLVAAYRRSDNGMAIARYGSGWSAPATFGGDYENVTAAASDDGELVLAGSKDGEIWATTAPSLAGGFSTLARLSPAGPGWRFPVAAGGGGRLVVAWGDHRGGQQRTLAAVSGGCTAAPPPQPTATPQPPPPAAPQPQPKPKAVTLADVVTLPSQKKCRSSVKLKFRKPAKRVAMTVNGKKVKVKVGKAITIKLRRRTTLKITVTLADGTKLKSTARFRPC